MGSVTPYEISGGRQYRVRYCKPERSQTDKRGFHTKREAELFFGSVEVAKNNGRYIDPTRARVSIGDWMTRWVATRTDLCRWTFDRLEGVVTLQVVPTLGPISIGDLGIPGLTPHELRHTCASLAVSAGANVMALWRMLRQVPRPA